MIQTWKAKLLDTELERIQIGEQFTVIFTHPGLIRTIRIYLWRVLRALAFLLVGVTIIAVWAGMLMVEAQSILLTLTPLPFIVVAGRMWKARGTPRVNIQTDITAKPMEETDNE